MMMVPKSVLGFGDGASTVSSSLRSLGVAAAEAEAALFCFAAMIVFCAAVITGGVGYVRATPSE